MFAIPATRSSHAPLTPRSANAQRFPSTPSPYHTRKMAMTMPLSPPITPPNDTSSCSGQYVFHTTNATPPLSAPQQRVPYQYGFPVRGGNPLVQGTDAQRRQSRRERYLGDVRSRREAALWSTRGDQMLQLDFLRNQRSWEAERARAAPEMVDANEVDIDMEAEAQKEDPQSTHMQPSQHSWEERHQQPSPHTQPQPDQHAYSSRHPNSNPELNTDEEIDAILRAEAQELEELVALHERQQQTQQHDFDHHRESVHEQELGANASSPLYGSENEDEFEEALVGLVDAAGDGGDAMDMS